jgi:hypothetical protein
MNSESDIELIVQGVEGEEPQFLDVISFLYDWNLLYEIARLATDERYSDVRFTHYLFYRKGRPLRSEDRMRLEFLSHQSPTKFATVPLQPE